LMETTRVLGVVFTHTPCSFLYLYGANPSWNSARSELSKLMYKDIISELSKLMYKV